MSWFSEHNLRLGRHTSQNPLSSAEARLRPGLAFLALWTFVCMALEIVLLQQIDSLRLYMTVPQILLDAGVALFVLLGGAVLWWLGILILGRVASAIPRTRRWSVPLCWFLWLAPPFGYLVARLSEAFKLGAFPQWHVPLVVQIFYSLALVLICTRGLQTLGLSGLQKFCRSRLAPLGWLHIGAILLCIVMLWIRGVYLFQNYANPGKTVAAQNLPDIYLITIDALRAQDTSVYGYDRPTTPNLQRFAKRSFTFDNFFANSNFTTPTTTTIETGKLPWSHRVFQYGGSLHDHAQSETLAAELRRHGYYTAMISSNFAASPFHHGTLASYDAVEYAAPLGVEGVWLRYTNWVGTNTQSTLTYSLLRRWFKLCETIDSHIWRARYFSPASAVFQKARALLERSDISQPRFVWTHIFPPHDPYWPPPPYRKRFPSSQSKRCGDMEVVNPKKLPAQVTAADLRACYDEMVLYADHAVGGFLDWLDQTGRLDRAIVIISSDHGESFENNWLLHGGARLQNGLIHVPLMVHLPGQQQGLRLQQLAQQVDILPTLLDFAGAPIPDWTDGMSLRPAMQDQKKDQDKNKDKDKPLPEHYIFSMNLEPDPVFGAITKGTVAVMDNEFKLVSTLSSQQQKLYRYKTDSLEKNNVIDSEPEVASRMHGALSSELKKVNESFATRQRELP